jgi:adenylate cyclase
VSAPVLTGQGTSRRRIFAVSAGVGLFMAIVSATPLGAYLDRVGIDLLQPVRVRLNPPMADPAQSAVAIVAIDEESYTKLGNFPKVVWTPWLATVIEALVKAKVKVVGLDIVFPTTLDTFVWHDTRPLQGIDGTFLQALNDAAADDRIVLGYASVNGRNIEPNASQKAAAEGAANLAPLNLELDADGVVRFYPANFPAADGSAAIPSLAFELARRAAIHSPGRGLLIDFALGPDHIPVYSMADLLACANAGKDGFFQDHFAGKAVIVADVLDVEDRWFTSASLVSVGRAYAMAPEAQPRCMASTQGAVPITISGRWKLPGAFIHATALNNLALGRWIEPLPRLPAALAVGVVGFAAAIVFYAISPALGAVITLIALVLMALAGAAVLGEGILLPTATGGLSIGLAYLVTAGDRVVLEQRGRQRVMDIFGAFLAPSIVRKLAADPKALAPVLREATIMFIDIVGYTSLTESLKVEPNRLISLLNEYLGLLADVVRKHDGYVDKFIGDAVLAVWNVPTVERLDAGRAAAAAALECADLVRAKSRERNDGIQVDVRIGIATGEVIGGLVGSATRVNYTVIGDAVNLASRLESANKLFGTRILICDVTESRLATAEAAAGEGAVLRRRLGRVRFKGKSEEREVYELLGHAREGTTAPAGDEFSGAVALFEGGDLVGAGAAFRALVEREPASRIYLEQISELERAPTRTEHPMIILQEK